MIDEAKIFMEANDIALQILEGDELQIWRSKGWSSIQEAQDFIAKNKPIVELAKEINADFLKKFKKGCAKLRAKWRKEKKKKIEALGRVGALKRIVMLIEANMGNSDSPSCLLDAKDIAKVWIKKLEREEGKIKEEK